jgi:hypothetical protein
LAQLVQPVVRPGPLDWVLVPTDLEGALESVVVADHLQQAGASVAIGVAARQHLVGLWPAVLRDIPIVQLDDERCDATRFVVWSDEDAAVVRLANAHGRNHVFSRPTGVGMFHVMRRGGQRRFRAGARILVRTRLEVAEYGDRPHAVIESGAHHALDTRTCAATCAVLVPDDFLGYPALDAWVASALRAAASLRPDVHLIGSQRAADRLAQLRFGPVDLELLRAEVVLPLTNAVTLVQSLGGRPVVFAPSIDRAVVSSTWLDGLDLAADECQVVEMLSCTDPARVGPGTVSPTELTRTDWAALFEKALVID